MLQLQAKNSCRVEIGGYPPLDNMASYVYIPAEDGDWLFHG